MARALSRDCRDAGGGGSGSEGWYGDRGGGMPPIRTRGALRRAPGCANRTENGGGGSGGARTAPERRHRALELPRAPQSTVLGDGALGSTAGAGARLPLAPGTGEGRRRPGLGRPRRRHLAGLEETPC